MLFNDYVKGKTKKIKIKSRINLSASYFFQCIQAFYSSINGLSFKHCLDCQKYTIKLAIKIKFYQKLIILLYFLKVDFLKINIKKIKYFLFSTVYIVGRFMILLLIF